MWSGQCLDAGTVRPAAGQRLGLIVWALASTLGGGLAACGEGDGGGPVASAGFASPAPVQATPPTPVVPPTPPAGPAPAPVVPPSPVAPPTPNPAAPLDDVDDMDDLDAFRLPGTLSQTGLYADVASETLADGVVPYAPRFELWSDGATKRRWLKLPPGTQITTDDMGAWRYPVGTKAFKEFSRDGVRVETRLLQKQNFGWLAVSYVWRDDLTDADAAPQGMPDARGTPHDVPNEDACYECHEGRPDMLLGVGALQLAWDAPPEPDSATLASLASAGWLSTPPPAAIPLPGDAVAKAALGGLHANCGSCHNPQNAETFSKAPGLDLWLPPTPLAEVAQAPAYLSTVDQELGDADENFTYRVVAGAPEDSGMLDRIQLPPGTSKAMPPLAIEDIDVAFVETLRQWISGLP